MGYAQKKRMDKSMKKTGTKTAVAPMPPIPKKGKSAKGKGGKGC